MSKKKKTKKKAGSKIIEATDPSRAVHRIKRFSLKDGGPVAKPN